MTIHPASQSHYATAVMTVKMGPDDDDTSFLHLWTETSVQPLSLNLDLNVQAAPLWKPKSNQVRPQ